MNVIIFGPPGAGKGTQALNIANKFNLHQVSTGDLLRNEVKNKTDIGKLIENIISKGDFATDEIVNELIKNEVHDSQKKIIWYLMGTLDLLVRLRTWINYWMNLVKK